MGCAILLPWIVLWRSSSWRDRVVLLNQGWLSLSAQARVLIPAIVQRLVALRLSILRTVLLVSRWSTHMQVRSSGMHTVWWWLLLSTKLWATKRWIVVWWRSDTRILLKSMRMNDLLQLIRLSIYIRLTFFRVVGVHLIRRQVLVQR